MKKNKSSEGRQSYGLYIATVTSAVTMHSSTCKYSSNKHGLGLCVLRSVSIQEVTYLFQIMHLFFNLCTTESSRCLLKVLYDLSDGT